MENGSNSLLSHVVAHRHIGAWLVDVILFLCDVHHACKSPQRKRGVDFQRRRKNHVGQRKGRSTKRVCGLLNILAEVMEQFHKEPLLVALCSIVSLPILRIGYSYFFGDSDISFLVYLLLYVKFNCVDMFAFLMP